MPGGLFLKVIKHEYTPMVRKPLIEKVCQCVYIDFIKGLLSELDLVRRL